MGPDDDGSLVAGRPHRRVELAEEGTLVLNEGDDVIRVLIRVCRSRKGRQLGSPNQQQTQGPGQRKGPAVGSFPVLGQGQLQVLGMIGDDHQIQTVPPGFPDTSFGQDLAVGVDGVDVEVRLDHLQALDSRKDDLLAGETLVARHIGPAVLAGQLLGGRLFGRFGARTLFSGDVHGD